MADSLSYVSRHDLPQPIDRIAPDLLDERAQQIPDKEAVVHVDENCQRHAMSFAQLKTATENVAAWLLSLGLGKGDNAAIFSRNSLDYVVCDLAMMRLGIVLTRLHVNFSIHRDLPQMLRVSGSRLLIVQESSISSILSFLPELATTPPGERLKSQHLPDLERVVNLGPARDGCLAFARDYVASDAEIAAVSAVQRTISPDDDCTIQPTSGSTGKPKLARINFAGYTNLMYQTLYRAQMTENDRLFTDRPIAHPLGTVMPCLQFGCTMVIADSAATMSASNNEFLRRVVREERVTCGIFLPYLLYDIVNGDDTKDFASLKFAISSGQTAPRDILVKIHQVIKLVCICYGSTEMSDVASTSATDDLDTILTTVGAPVPHIQVRVVDENGRVVPRNTTGEIEVKRKYFNGYKNDEENTKKSMPTAGWFRPGDMVQMDEHGRLRIFGRSSEVISMGARKIFPAVVENPLLKLAKVDKVVAFGVPDERLNEKVAVCVKPKDGVVITPDEILEFAASQMRDDEQLTGIGFRPTYAFIRDTFPVTASGKVDRAAIARMCIAELAAR